MPNTRRRRFSVQNDIGGRDSSKMQNGLKNSHQEVNDIKTAVTNLVSMRASKSKNKMFANSSKNSNNLEIVAECESSTSQLTNTENDNYNKSSVDKDVTASSSNIDLFNLLAADELSAESFFEDISPIPSQGREREARPVNRDKTPLRREKFPRQHRVKVRSPRRRMPLMEQKATENIRRTVGTAPIDWDQVEVTVEQVTNLSLPTENPSEDHQRLSSHSLEDMCRICHGGDSMTTEVGQLISACSCRGTVGRVHVKCLERWLTESGKSRCELCGTRYQTRRVHRYGVPRALLMWVLSQNAKQLMVDSLGIMLMSPLAVLAAWLSGRTLAGLMTQDSHATPWPLASTFVLACMTLVCYYCWIVSAATRHALGWWIWYRSQYEVRLQFQEIEE